MLDARVPRASKRMKLSVIVPAYNEEANIRPLYDRLVPVLTGLTDEYEILFVDDGSTDETLPAIQDLARKDPRVGFVSFSRNFGHEIASTAGLDRAEGDAVVLIDADLQDPPELIATMVDRWRDGVEVVYAQRRRRARESVLKRFTAWCFYRLIRLLSSVDIPPDTGDFRLMDRRVVEAVRQCREVPRFVRGLVAWVGFRQQAVLYDRDPRHEGETKYGFGKLVRLSLEAILGFSLVPLRLMIWLGLAIVALSVVLVIIVAVEKFIAPANQGYAFLASGIFFLGGVQLTMLGVIAHYLGHVFERSQARPLYVVRHEADSRLAIANTRSRENTIVADSAARDSDG